MNCSWKKFLFFSQSSLILLMPLVLVTTLVGHDVGLTGSADYLRLIHLLVGTLLAAGGTLALNQYWERDVDARMDRTRARPLPAGRCGRG